jgi:hypothetical protein
MIKEGGRIRRSRTSRLWRRLRPSTNLLQNPPESVLEPIASMIIQIGRSKLVDLPALDLHDRRDIFWMPYQLRSVATPRAGWRSYSGIHADGFTGVDRPSCSRGRLLRVHHNGRRGVYGTADHDRRLGWGIVRVGWSAEGGDIRHHHPNDHREKSKAAAGPCAVVTCHFFAFPIRGAWSATTNRASRSRRTSPYGYASPPSPRKPLLGFCPHRNLLLGIVRHHTQARGCDYAIGGAVWPNLGCGHPPRRALTHSGWPVKVCQAKPTSGRCPCGPWVATVHMQSGVTAKSQGDSSHLPDA